MAVVRIHHEQIVFICFYNLDEFSSGISTCELSLKTQSDLNAEPILKLFDHIFI
jgi:hypothetical protein